MSAFQIGHLLHASTSGFVAGCSFSQLEATATTEMAFGALVRVSLNGDSSVYGLIYDIHIDEDGLVRQLVTAENVSQEVIRDNRERRIVPVEISVLTVGYEAGGRVSHLLPPRPPLSLDIIYLCSDAELAKFIGTGKLGYLRHILQAKDIPVGELLAAHIRQVRQRTKNEAWVGEAAQEIITQLRDDYPMLMSVLGALGDALPA